MSTTLCEISFPIRPYKESPHNKAGTRWPTYPRTHKFPGKKKTSLLSQSNRDNKNQVFRVRSKRFAAEPAD